MQEVGSAASNVLNLEERQLAMAVNKTFVPSYKIYRHSKQADTKYTSTHDPSFDSYERWVYQVRYSFRFGPSSVQSKSTKTLDWCPDQPILTRPCPKTTSPCNCIRLLTSVSNHSRTKELYTRYSRGTTWRRPSSGRRRQRFT